MKRTYLAYYHECPIQATSSYHAQNLAAMQFGVRKSWQVSVILADEAVGPASIG